MAAVPKPLGDAPAPSRIGRYDIVTEIASGGMATVFLGRLGGVGGFQRLVAIKRLHPHLANEQEFVAMFLDEARLVARIHHQNVVPILDVDEGERGYYLVMDYVEGATLASLISLTVSAQRKAAKSEASVASVGPRDATKNEESDASAGRRNTAKPDESEASVSQGNAAKPDESEASVSQGKATKPDESVASASSGPLATPPIPVVVRILLDVLNGLHAAHELKDDEGVSAGLVHRDVSPQNVLVGVDGVTRIADFGVAQAVTRLSATKAGQLKGKLAYMAPEQASPEAPIDRRIDVFAAGVVLWEALAGRRLFKSHGEAATLKRVLELEIPHVSAVQSNVPRPLGDVCAKALERSPADRYPDCAAFALALEQAAIETGDLGNAREVAVWVETVAGEKIEKQRASVREWTSSRDDSTPSKSSTRLQTLRDSAQPMAAGELAGEQESTQADSADALNVVAEKTDHELPRPRAYPIVLKVALLIAVLASAATVVLLLVPARREPPTEAANQRGAPVLSPRPDRGDRDGTEPTNVAEPSSDVIEENESAISPQALPRPAARARASAPSRRSSRPKTEGFDSIERENPYK